MARPADPLRRAAIIQAALEHFAEVGFANAKVGDIAEKCKAGKGTIYHHFVTKEDLLLEAVLHHCALARADVDKALGGAGGWSTAMPTSGSGTLADPDRALFHLLKTIMAVIPRAGQPRTTLFVDLWAASRSRPDILVKAQARLSDMYVQWESLIAYLVMAGQAKGLFRHGMAGRTLARICTTAMDGQIWQLTFRPEAADPDYPRQFAESILCGLLADPARIAEVRS